LTNTNYNLSLENNKILKIKWKKTIL
jgi:hypothetical protein